MRRKIICAGLFLSAMLVQAGSAGTKVDLEAAPEWTHDRWSGASVSLQQAKSGKAGFQSNKLRIMDYSYVRYRSDRKWATYAPNLEEEDFAAERIREMHDAGMKALGYIVPNRAELAETGKHDHWLMLNAAGNPIIDHGQCLDFMSPWGDELIARCKEVVDKYDLDAFYLDGFTYQLDGGMKGKYARERYRKDTGREMPEKRDLKDENYRRWLFWRGDILGEYLTKFKTELRKEDPNIAVYVNALRFQPFPDWQQWGYETVDRAADVPCAEFSPYIGCDPLHKRFNYSRFRGIRGDRPAETWMVSTMGWSAKPGSVPGTMPELYSRVYEALTQRIQIALYPMHVPDRHMKELLDNINKRGPFLKKAVDVEWAAIVVGEHDDAFYQLTERVTGYRHNYEEIFRILCEMHVPVDVISEVDVTPETLKKYSLVALPGQHCLSDQSVQNIKDYVAEGGGLLATDMTSRWDEWANPRKNFALSELFGCDYVGHGSVLKKPENKRMLSVNAGHPVFAGDDMADTFLNNSFLFTDEKAIYENFFQGSLSTFEEMSFDGRDILSMYKCPGRILETKPHAGVKPIAWLLDEAKKPLYPAVYANTFGKGKVVYIPMNIGGMYGETSYPQWRLLVDQACR
ncbi:MAG: alpha-amylase family protein, partial [Verrucomicrobiota bacterium]